MAGIGLPVAANYLGSSISFFVQLTNSEVLKIIAHLGIFFIVLLGGTESEPQQLKQHSKIAMILAMVRGLSTRE